METRQTGVERELPSGEVEHLGTTVSLGLGSHAGYHKPAGRIDAKYRPFIFAHAHALPPAHTLPHLPLLPPQERIVSVTPPSAPCE